MQEGYSDRPFHLPESREWVSHVKSVPPASGCRKTPLTLEVENLKLKNLCEKTCYFSDLLPQVQTLFRFFTNCAQSFIALSLPHKFSVSLSRKHKSSLLWPFLRSHFYEVSLYLIKVWCFSLVNRSCAHFIISPDTTAQEGEKGKFPPSCQ